MFIIKLILCLILAAASLGIGLYLSSRLSERIRVLESYLAMLESAAVKLRYTTPNLAELFADNFAGADFSQEQPFDDQFRQMTRMFKDVLKPEDIALLDDFTRELGVSDTDSQLQHIRLYLSLLGERLTQAREDQSRKGKLYRTVPLSAGIAAAILMI